MKLIELLNTISEISVKNGTSKPYLCGGAARDKYLGKLKSLSDIDVTTGDKSIDFLAQEASIYLNNKFNIKKKTHEDGHVSLYFGNLKLDFSSNFNTPNIEEYLIKMGIKSPTDMEKEVFSRDFTCNALLLDFDLKNILDPTNMGFKDLDNKIIRTCLPAAITLTSNKNRVVRAIYLAAKLGFDLDQSIIDFVKKNPTSINIALAKSLNEKLNLAFQYDAERSSELISRMNLWNYIPISSQIQPYYMKHVGKNAK